MTILDITGIVQIGGLLLGGGVLSTIITSFVQWRRFRKKDSSETEKTDAETEKLKMEAFQIKTQAEVTISEAALKLVQRITEECDEIRKNVDKLEEQLIILNSELKSERDKNVKLLAEIETLKKGS